MSRNTTEFTLALAGDAIINRRVSRLPSIQPIAERIRSLDAAAVNLEVVPTDYEGYPKDLEAGDITISAPPWVLDELAWMGFDLFAAANNHIGDFSHAGMERTMRELEARDMAYAGIGRHLDDARAPAYVDTPAGRVALVSVCSSISPGSIAGRQRRDMQGRPGLSPLRFTTRYVLSDERFEQLRGITAELGQEELKAGRSAPRDVVDGEEVHHFLDMDRGWVGAPIRFERGEEPGIRRRGDPRDLEEIGNQISRADRQADWVIVSLHGHEGPGGRLHTPTPDPFIEDFARACIDDGADVFFSHGPHQLRGIELYEGAPIFYSLGDFMSQQETMTTVSQDSYDLFGLPDDALPADVFDARYFDDASEDMNKFSTNAYWESFVPVCRFDGDGLARIEVTPLELGMRGRRPRRGVPAVATGEDAHRVLSRLAELSAAYGTEVEIEAEDGLGVVTP